MFFKTFSKKYSQRIPLCFGFFKIFSSHSSCPQISLICLFVSSREESFFVISSIFFVASFVIEVLISACLIVFFEFSESLKSIDLFKCKICC